MIRSIRTGWVWRTVRIGVGGQRSAYKNLNNSRETHTEKDNENVNRYEVDQERVQSQTLVNTVMNLLVP
jgi:hypothetical protein